MKKIRKIQQAGVSQLAEETDSKPVQCGFESHRQYYSYILGMYLGDGHITRQPRTYRLRIYLDNKYPDIIKECVHSLSAILPNNKVSIYRPGRNAGDCSVVVVHSQKIAAMFPQHGAGEKHTRKIRLETWQEEIVQEHPKQFLRGLIHSDGCRDANVVNNKSYPRYSFSQKSQDIMKIFQRACDELGIAYTKPRPIVTAISKRKYVDFMDSFIGPKS